jgi:hypothetical protein
MVYSSGQGSKTLLSERPAYPYVVNTMRFTISGAACGCLSKEAQVTPLEHKITDRIIQNRSRRERSLSNEGREVWS